MTFKRPIRNCSAPWEWLVVGPEGSAQPCCFTFDQVGDLKEASVDEIWNGPRMVRLRKAIAGGFIDPICRRATCAFVLNTVAQYGDLSFDYSCQTGETYIVGMEDELRHLCEGWSIAEPWGVWSEGAKSVMKLDFAAPPEQSHTLRLLCRGYANEIVPRRVIKVHAGRQEVAEWVFCHPEDTQSSEWRTITLDPEHMIAGQVEISFHLTDELSPLSVGINDGRKLGIGISGFTVAARLIHQ